MVEYLNETTQFDGIYLRKIREGGTFYWIPDPQYYAKPGHYLPSELPVFYNPMMELNRDLSILTLATYLKITDKEPEDLTYVELLAGTGIRGFRVLNEVGTLNVILNDLDINCVRLMHFNAKFFPTDIQSHATILNYEANHLLSSIKLWKKSVDAMDIDPFGTPAPFLDSAVRATKRKLGLLLLTATDTSALIGKFPQSARRKYGVYLKAVPFCNEIAVRALIYHALSVATKYRIGLRPLFGFFFTNFIKVALLTVPGRKASDVLLEKKSGWLKIEGTKIETLERPRGTLDGDLIGPIWLDTMYDEEFIKEVLGVLNKVPIGATSRTKLETWFKAELKTASIPFYYDIELIASNLKKSTPKIREVIAELQRLGFIAERTHFSPKAVKTNAPPEILIEIIKRL
ncbi:MAG: hypothetical protein NDP13_02505 [Crenarchaeota archaeon]|nr:hypothetical protein [Thermoproteota archaeon]MCR8455339.1 hypothetical protein [Thermoproteota archaeon]MCR8501394.1 hypothetical protein [Thermoproteota archaeon]